MRALGSRARKRAAQGESSWMAARRRYGKSCPSGADEATVERLRDVRLSSRGGPRVPRGARSAASRRAPRPRADPLALGRRARAASTDEELAARAGVPVEVAPLMRGAHDLVEARRLARSCSRPPVASPTELRRRWGVSSSSERRSGRARRRPGEGDDSRAEGGGRSTPALCGALTGRSVGRSSGRCSRAAVRAGAAARIPSDDALLLMSRGRWSNCRRCPVRSGGTSAGRRSTCGRTSGTCGRSWSGCGCGWLRSRGYEAAVHSITDINDKIYDAAPGASARAR